MDPSKKRLFRRLCEWNKNNLHKKKARMNAVDSSRATLKLVKSKVVELTNIKTNEVLSFASLGDTTKYVQNIFDKAKPGTLSDVIQK